MNELHYLLRSMNYYMAKIVQFQDFIAVARYSLSVQYVMLLYLLCMIFSSEWLQWKFLFGAHYQNFSIHAYWLVMLSCSNMRKSLNNLGNYQCLKHQLRPHHCECLEKGFPNFSTCRPHKTLLYKLRARQLKY